MRWPEDGCAMARCLRCCAWGFFHTISQNRLIFQIITEQSSLSLSVHAHTQSVHINTLRVLQTRLHGDRSAGQYCLLGLQLISIVITSQSKRMLSYLLVEDASFVDSTGAIFTLVLFVVLVRFLDVFFILVDM